MQTPRFLDKKIIKFIFPDATDLSTVMNISMSWNSATNLGLLVLENREKVLGKSWNFFRLAVYEPWLLPPVRFLIMHACTYFYENVIKLLYCSIHQCFLPDPLRIYWRNSQGILQPRIGYTPNYCNISKLLDILILNLR